MGELGENAPKEGEVLVSSGRIRVHRLVRYLLELVCGEVRRICDRTQARDEGRLDVPDGYPVDAVEEGVVLDLLDG